MSATKPGTKRTLADELRDLEALVVELRVERGVTPPRPTLTLIRGGKADDDA